MLYKHINLNTFLICVMFFLFSFLYIKDVALQDRTNFADNAQYTACFPNISNDERNIIIEEIKNLKQNIHKLNEQIKKIVNDLQE